MFRTLAKTSTGLFQKEEVVQLMMECEMIKRQFYECRNARVIERKKQNQCNIWCLKTKKINKLQLIFRNNASS